VKRGEGGVGGEEKIMGGWGNGHGGRDGLEVRGCEERWCRRVGLWRGGGDGVGLGGNGGCRAGGLGGVGWVGF